jgi:hypothetical protein
VSTNRTDRRKPFPFTDTHPRFRVRGWRELLGKGETLPAAEMVRHYLATGETGSGKSASVVMPITEAVLRYPEDDLYADYAQSAGGEAEDADSLRPTVLVIDPKQELEEIVKREARGRRIIRVAYGEKGPVLHLFEGRDLKRLDPYEAMDFILQQSEFYVRDQASTREPCWNLQAASLLRDFISIDMWLAKRSMDEVRDLWDRTRKTLEKDDDLKSMAESVRYNPRNYFKAMETILSLAASEEGSMALAGYLNACNALGVPGDLTVRLITLVTMYHSTRSGVIFMANGILVDIASDELAACVSLNPLESPHPSELLSVRKVLERGDAVVYIPTSGVSSTAETVGRCLKSKFFEFAFERANKVRPFFYIVDEAHRFISAGEQDGEQSLLDRCRAFRTGVVLSTQSIASMAFKLQGSISGGDNALEILLNNCGTALYFRTSDIRTQNNVRERIPGPPVRNRPHVVQVRPLASLPVGCCYATQCSGKWGLFQVHLSE